MVTSAGGVRHQETEHWLAFVWLPPIVKRRLEYGDETVRAHCQILRSVLEAERLLDPTRQGVHCNYVLHLRTHTTESHSTSKVQSIIRVAGSNPALVMTKTLDSVAIEIIGLNF